MLSFSQLSPFHSGQDTRPLNGNTHIQGELSSIKPPQRHPDQYSYKVCLQSGFKGHLVDNQNSLILITWKFIQVANSSKAYNSLLNMILLGDLRDSLIHKALAIQTCRTEFDPPHLQIKGSLGKNEKAEGQSFLEFASQLVHLSWQIPGLPELPSQQTRWMTPE